MVGYREWRLSQFVEGRRKLPNGQTIPLTRKVSPRTVNREVGTLNNMLGKGVEWQRIGSNPIKGLKPLRHDSPCKDRRRSTLAKCNGSSMRARRTYDRCGGCSCRLRFGEPSWSTCDSRISTSTERRSRSCAEMAKNHKAREIPLGDTMLAMLAELRDAAGHRRPVEGLTPSATARQAALFTRDHVFVTRANTPLKNNLLQRFYAVCDKAGIDDAHPGGNVDLHSLRVTCATLMLQNGANPKDVQAILGHSTLALTMKVYAKATERGKRSAIDALPFDMVTSPAHLIAV